MDQIQVKIKLNGWFEKLEVWHGNQGKRKKGEKKRSSTLTCHPRMDEQLNRFQRCLES